MTDAMPAPIKKTAMLRRTKLPERPLALQTATYLVLLLCLGITALPRVVHPAIPDNVSGLDLIAPILAVWLGIVFFVRRRFFWPRGLLVWIAIIPLIMLFSTLLGFLAFGDDEGLRRGALQAIRRTPAALFALVISQVVLTPLQATRLLKAFLLALLVGGALFYVVEKYQPFGFGNRSRLSGNFLTDDAESDDAPEMESGGMLVRVRQAGNVGSATVYGLLCATGMILAAELIRSRRAGYFFGGGIYLVLAACLMASAAKAAIAAAAIAQVVMLIYYRRLRPLGVVIGVVLLIAFSGPYMAQLLDNMSNRSQSSFDQRLVKYDRAFTLVNNEPIRILIGHGWRSNPVGWHSEIVEVLMSYGILFGSVMLFIIYLYFPYLLLRLPGPDDLFSRVSLFLIFAATAISSFFQDLFQDPSVLLMFAVIIGISTRTQPSSSGGPDAMVVVRAR
jgi:hypothetical protein